MQRSNRLCMAVAEMLDSHISGLAIAAKPLRSDTGRVASFLLVIDIDLIRAQMGQQANTR